MSNRLLCPLGGPHVFQSISDVETDTRVVIAALAVFSPNLGEPPGRNLVLLNLTYLETLYVVYGSLVADTRP